MSTPPTEPDHCPDCGQRLAEGLDKYRCSNCGAPVPGAVWPPPLPIDPASGNQRRSPLVGWGIFAGCLGMVVVVVMVGIVVPSMIGSTAPYFLLNYWVALVIGPALVAIASVALRRRSRPFAKGLGISLGVAAVIAAAVVLGAFVICIQATNTHYN